MAAGRQSQDAAGGLDRVAVAAVLVVGRGLAQRYRRLEYVVVDDGSTDDTPGLLARHGDALVVLRQDHGGEARAVQRGIDRARGEYVVVVNSDDPLLPGLIEEQVAVLEIRRELLACYPDYREAGATLIGEATGAPPNHYGQVSSFSLPNSGVPVYYSTRFFRLIPDANPPALFPDIEAAPSAADYLAGRDPVLEAIASRSP